MTHRRTMLVILLTFTLGCTVLAQTPTMLQTPRQAVIEMFSGTQENLTKHLTIEVQNKLAQTPELSNFFNAVAMAKAQGSANGGDIQSFPTGPILFSATNPMAHEKIDVRVENDNVRGEIDEMELSFRVWKDGKEQNLPVGFRVILGMKQQANVWRLNTFTFSVKLPLGDPVFYDPNVWRAPMLAAAAGAGQQPQPAMVRAAPPVEAKPKMSPIRAVRIITEAEHIYSRKHPSAGFTCNLGDLVNVGHGISDGEPYTFIDQDLAAGIYNGYRFTVSGCAGKPSSGFQVTAEPLAQGGRAYCSDASRNLRMSEDGHGGTCLASGSNTVN